MFSFIGQLLLKVIQIMTEEFVYVNIDIRDEGYVSHTWNETRNTSLVIQWLVLPDLNFLY